MPPRSSHQSSASRSFHSTTTCIACSNPPRRRACGARRPLRVFLELVGVVADILPSRCQPLQDLSSAFSQHRAKCARAPMGMPYFVTQSMPWPEGCLDNRKPPDAATRRRWRTCPRTARFARPSCPARPFNLSPDCAGEWPSAPERPFVVAPSCTTAYRPWTTAPPQAPRTASSSPYAPCRTPAQLCLLVWPEPERDEQDGLEIRRPSSSCWRAFWLKTVEASTAVARPPKEIQRTVAGEWVSQSAVLPLEGWGKGLQ